MAHVQREGALTALDFAKGQDLAAAAIAGIDAKAKAAAEGGIRRAREELVTLQELLQQLADETASREIEQVTVPAMNELADELEGVIFDARDAPKVFRDMAKADEDLAESLAPVIEHAHGVAAGLDGVVLEARHASNALSEFMDVGATPTITGLASLEIKAGQTANVLRDTVAGAAGTVESAFGSLFASLVRGTDVFSQFISSLLAEAGRLAGSFIFRWLLGLLFPPAVATISPLVPIGIGGGGFGSFFQQGGQMIVTRPTLFSAGEGNRAERVSVSPLAGGMAAAGAGGGVTVVFQGPTFMDEIAEARLLRKLDRMRR